MLGSIVAAGFYKFIKILEYETANPDQDMDHAAKVQRRKDLLMEAGIDEADAHHVANELSEKRIVGKNGAPDGIVLANGQGRNSREVDHEGMYGTGFRPSSISTDRTVVQPERPVPFTNASQAGRYSYLGKSGRKPLTGTDSPAIASHNAPNEALGHSAVNEARNRFAGTASSGV